MSDISKAIDQLLKESLSEKLKSVGFKKKKRCWYRKYENRIEKIAVEASTWNMGGSGTFWLWFSVYIPEIARGFKREIVGDEPKGFESGIFKLLGELMPERRQDHWKVTVGTDNSNETQALSSAVDTYGLPWFDTIRNESGLIEFLKERNHWNVLAVIYHLRGLDSEKLAAINKVIEFRGRPEGETLEWAKSLGLVES